MLKSYKTLAGLYTGLAIQISKEAVGDATFYVFKVVEKTEAQINNLIDKASEVFSDINAAAFKYLDNWQLQPVFVFTDGNKFRLKGLYNMTGVNRESIKKLTLLTHEVFSDINAAAFKYLDNWQLQPVFVFTDGSHFRLKGLYNMTGVNRESIKKLTLLTHDARQYIRDKENRYLAELEIETTPGNKEVIQTVVEGEMPNVQGAGNLFKQFDVASEFAKGLTSVTKSFVNKNGNTVNLVWKKVGNKIEFGSRSDIRLTLGLTSGTGTEAHHIITWTKGGDHKIVQLAAEDGFHLNMFENAVELEKYFEGVGGMHGNHPAFDAFMEFRLNDFDSRNPVLSAAKANEYLQQILIPELSTHINGAKNSTLNLNEYFKQIVNPNTGVPGF